MYFILSALIASFLAPLVLPFTGGILFYALHEWFEPRVWGLPAIDSIIGVSSNVTFIGYFFMFMYGLPVALILRFFGKYQFRLLLLLSILPAVVLLYFQSYWIGFICEIVSGLAVASAFWYLTNFIHKNLLKYKKMFQ